MSELLSLLMPIAPAGGSIAGAVALGMQGGAPASAPAVDAAAFTAALQHAMTSVAAPAAEAAPAAPVQTPLGAELTRELVHSSNAAQDDVAVTTSPADVPLAAMTPPSVGAPPPVTGTTSPTSRSLDALDPAFRTRLERVIGRVEQELGYEVRVLETYRSPERQQALYEQGRARPGNVVTWTRNSLHSEGRASDLLLVGAPADGKAYVRLGEIAAEEGLRTLGPRDPGHVELPRTGAAPTSRVATAPTPESTSAVQRIMEIARAAGRTVPRAQDVSTFAHEVARAAFVTRAPQPVAASYTPTAVSGTSTPVVPLAPVTAPADRAPIQPAVIASAAPAAAPTAPVPVKPTGSAPMTKPSLSATDASCRVGPEPVCTDVTPVADVTSQAPAMTAEPARSAAPTPAPARVDAPTAVEPVLAPDVAGRIERVVALQEALAAQPMHSLLLRLDENASQLAQIRVGMRGNEVTAALGVSDPTLASALRTDLPELQRALERHGLETTSLDSLRVLAGTTAEPAAATRVTNAAATRDGDSMYRQPQGGQHREPQQRQRGQQRREKEQP